MEFFIYNTVVLLSDSFYTHPKEFVCPDAHLLTQYCLSCFPFPLPPGHLLFPNRHFARCCGHKDIAKIVLKELLD